MYDTDIHYESHQLQNNLQIRTQRYSTDTNQ